MFADNFVLQFYNFLSSADAECKFITHWLSSNLLWFALLNNKAFGNLFCNPQEFSHLSGNFGLE